MKENITYKPFHDEDDESDIEPDRLTHARACRLLGEAGLACLNKTRKEKDAWPAGQAWEDLGCSSRWTCVHAGIHLLKIIPTLVRVQDQLTRILRSIR